MDDFSVRLTLEEAVMLHRLLLEAREKSIAAAEQLSGYNDELAGYNTEQADRAYSLAVKISSSRVRALARAKQRAIRHVTAHFCD